MSAMRKMLNNFWKLFYNNCILSLCEHAVSKLSSDITSNPSIGQVVLIAEDRQDTAPAIVTRTDHRAQERKGRPSSICRAQSPLLNISIIRDYQKTCETFDLLGRRVMLIFILPAEVIRLPSAGGSVENLVHGDL